MSELFSLKEASGMSARDLCSTHSTLVRRIEEDRDLLQNRKLIWKVHLLSCLHNLGGEYDVVEHACATDRDKTYEDTLREILSRSNRLDGGDNSSSAVSEGYTAEDEGCFNCGSKGHWKNECPHLVHTHQGGKAKGKERAKGKEKEKARQGRGKEKERVHKGKEKAREGRKRQWRLKARRTGRSTKRLQRRNGTTRIKAKTGDKKRMKLLLGWLKLQMARIGRMGFYRRAKFGNRI